MDRSLSIRLGSYQFFERLGEGGSGQVYRAAGPDGPVAVKVLAPAAELDDAARARFHREIATLAAVRHPALVELLDHGDDPELGAYLVLPLLAGLNLRALVAGRALCPEAAIALAQPVVAATAAMHAAGFVHRDLKPENVMAGPDGKVTVIDLGLAWRDGMTRHTDTGAAVGSIGYMAPEQIEGRTVGPAADVYALGVMLFEWVAGKRPFARARPTEEAAAVLIGACPKLSAVDRRTDDALADLVARCLAPDPAARPSATALGEGLAAMIDWAPVDGMDAERAAVVGDPVGYQARVAPLRVRRAERQAREALAGGRPFVALARCDRGLAYAPERAELLALVGEIEAATATAAPRPAPVTTPPVPAAATVDSNRPVVTAEAPAAVAVISTTAPVAAPAPSARRRELLVVGVIAVGIAVAVAIAVRSGGGAGSPVRLGGTPTVTTTGPGGAKTTTTASPDDTRDGLALAGTMLSLFDRALTASEKQKAEGAVGDKERLCMTMVKAEDSGAVDACDAVVKLHPDDPNWHGLRGVARYRAGALDDALEDLGRAIAGDPDPSWLVVRGKVYAKRGDRAAALDDWKRACDLGDHDGCARQAEPAP